MKFIMRFLPAVLLVVAVVVVTLVSVFVLPGFINALSNGADFKDIGISGLVNNYNTGKNAGLSAKDTESVLNNRVKDCNNMQILAVNANITDFHNVKFEPINSESDDTDSNTFSFYKNAALYQFKAEVIFSIDFSKAESKEINADTVKIKLPKLQSKVIINDDETKLIAEYNSLFSGSSKDGVNAYLNSVYQIKNKANKTAGEIIDNYTDIENRAKDSVQDLLDSIVKGVYGKDKKVEVEFSGD